MTRRGQFYVNKATGEEYVIINDSIEETEKNFTITYTMSPISKGFDFSEVIEISQQELTNGYYPLNPIPRIGDILSRKSDNFIEDYVIYRIDKTGVAIVRATTNTFSFLTLKELREDYRLIKQAQ